MEDIKKRLVEIRGTIKHDSTDIMDKRGMGNSNYHPDQII